MRAVTFGNQNIDSFHDFFKEGQWLCAGAEGRDACQGFGGAPLVIRENGVHTQIGIMSFGSDNCGAIRVPSVYTSIAHFSQWIKDNSPIE